MVLERADLVANVGVAVEREHVLHIVEEEGAGLQALPEVVDVGRRREARPSSPRVGGALWARPLTRGAPAPCTVVCGGQLLS